MSYANAVRGLSVGLALAAAGCGPMFDAPLAPTPVATPTPVPGPSPCPHGYLEAPTVSRPPVCYVPAQ